jgi:hypothetical protein
VFDSLCCICFFIVTPMPLYLCHKGRLSAHNDRIMIRRERREVNQIETVMSA